MSDKAEHAGDGAYVYVLCDKGVGRKSIDLVVGGARQMLAAQFVTGNPSIVDPIRAVEHAGHHIDGALISPDHLCFGGLATNYKRNMVVIYACAPVLRSAQEAVSVAAETHGMTADINENDPRYMYLHGKSGKSQSRYL